MWTLRCASRDGHRVIYGAVGRPMMRSSLSKEDTAAYATLHRHSVTTRTCLSVEVVLIKGTKLRCDERLNEGVACIEGFGSSRQTVPRPRIAEYIACRTWVPLCRIRRMRVAVADPILVSRVRDTYMIGPTSELEVRSHSFSVT